MKIKKYLPNKGRPIDDVRILATYFRFLTFQSRRRFEQEAALKFALLADALDWVCGVELPQPEKLFQEAQRALRSNVAELKSEGKPTDVKDFCDAIRTNLERDIKEFEAAVKGEITRRKRMGQWEDS